METGIELITRERTEQIFDHKRSVEDDVIDNSERQLSKGATRLILNQKRKPRGWDERGWGHMINKPYKERLIIAGALIAAEIDRLNYEEQMKGEMK
jgi:hypothetical protein